MSEGIAPMAGLQIDRLSRKAKRNLVLGIVILTVIAALITNWTLGTGKSVASAPTTAPATTVPASTRWACVTSTLKGHCPFGPNSQITGASSAPWVDQNVWSPVPGWQQTLSADSPNDFQVVANMPVGNTGVVAYPNSGVYFSGAVDSYSRFTSSFVEDMHKTHQTSGWAMFDLWFNNWHNEVMIQYDFANNGDCDSLATATFGGSNGVPVQNWHLCEFGSTLDWKLGNSEANRTSEQSGSVDILAMIEWLEAHGYLPGHTTWTGFSNGWEICSTGGQNETLQMSSYSVTAS